MAAGDRTKYGRPTDSVRHFGLEDAGEAMCGNIKAGYVSTDWADITCKNCLSRKSGPRFWFYHNRKRYERFTFSAIKAVVRELRLKAIIIECDRLYFTKYQSLRNTYYYKPKK